MANAFVTLLQGLGHTDLESFGDSSAALPLTYQQANVSPIVGG
jgi:hypothetical protein